jgi:hypothetical protein
MREYRISIKMKPHKKRVVVDFKRIKRLFLQDQ